MIGVHFAEAADELVALRKALADEADKPTAPQAGPVSQPGPFPPPPQQQRPGPQLPQQPAPPAGGYPNAPQHWQQPPGQQPPWPQPQQPR